ncbi:MAG: LPS export ABC transporter permease LptG [Rhizobiaceae bacterium]|nr:LPS export ABC transporter permease LptG [Rhizobiaceae bacterium]
MTGATLWTYLTRRYLVMLAQVLAAIMVVVFLVDFTEYARRAGGIEGYTTAKGLYFSAMRLPFIVMLVWPMVVLFASMAALHGLNRRSELVIARASGLSAWQFLAPICLASLVVGIFAVTVINPLSAYCLEQVKVLETAFRGWDAAEADRDRPWLRQTTDEGVTIIGAGQTANRGLLLGDAVFLRFDNEGTLVARYDARSATLSDGAWRLENVRRTSVNEVSEEIDSVEIKSGIEPEYVEERFADHQTIPIYELPRKIAAAEALGIPAYRFSMHFHSLLALPALLVAMTLIAATVSLRFNRMGQLTSMILGGILAGFLLYVALVVFTAFGNVGFVAPVMAAWVPVISALFFGVTFLLYTEDG